MLDIVLLGIIALLLIWNIRGDQRNRLLRSELDEAHADNRRLSRALRNALQATNSANVRAAQAEQRAVMPWAQRVPFSQN